MKTSRKSESSFVWRQSAIIRRIRGPMLHQSGFLRIELVRDKDEYLKEKIHMFVSRRGLCLACDEPRKRRSAGLQTMTDRLPVAEIWFDAISPQCHLCPIFCVLAYRIRG